MRGLRYLIDKQGAPPPSPPPSCSRRMATMLAYVAICREGCGLMHASNNLTSGAVPVVVIFCGVDRPDCVHIKKHGICAQQQALLVMQQFTTTEPSGMPGPEGWT